MNTELLEFMRKNRRIICNIFISSGNLVNENQNNLLLDVIEA